MEDFKKFMALVWLFICLVLSIGLVLTAIDDTKDKYDMLMWVGIYIISVATLVSLAEKQ